MIIRLFTVLATAALCAVLGVALVHAGVINWPAKASLAEQYAVPAEPLVRNVDCSHARNVTIPAPGVNVSAHLWTQPDGSTSHWAEQYLCTGETRRVEVARVESGYDPSDPTLHTLHIHWVSEVPTQWSSLSLLSASDTNEFRLLDPDQTSYTYMLKPGEKILGIIVGGNAPSLPPAVNTSQRSGTPGP